MHGFLTANKKLLLANLAFNIAQRFDEIHHIEEINQLLVAREKAFDAEMDLWIRDTMKKLEMRRIANSIADDEQKQKSILAAMAAFALMKKNMEIELLFQIGIKQLNTIAENFLSRLKSDEFKHVDENDRNKMISMLEKFTKLGSNATKEDVKQFVKDIYSVENDAFDGFRKDVSHHLESMGVSRGKIEKWAKEGRVRRVEDEVAQVEEVNTKIADIQLQSRQVEKVVSKEIGAIQVKLVEEDRVVVKEEVEEIVVTIVAKEQMVDVVEVRADIQEQGADVQEQRTDIQEQRTDIQEQRTDIQDKDVNTQEEVLKNVKEPENYFQETIINQNENSVSRSSTSQIFSIVNKDPQATQEKKIAINEPSLNPSSSQKGRQRPSRRDRIANDITSAEEKENELKSTSHDQNQNDVVPPSKKL